MPDDDFEYAPVVSTNISEVAYRESDETLQVSFHTGSTYEFDGVSRTVFENLRDAASVGNYFNQNIKSRYQGRKV